jgi:hypothetical protein
MRVQQKYTAVSAEHQQGQWCCRPCVGQHTSRAVCPRRGMLPGYVSGFYSYEDCHIDLGRLSRYAGAALVQQEATGIDIKVGAAAVWVCTWPLQLEILCVWCWCVC